MPRREAGSGREERAEIEAIVSRLPKDHPARQACEAGAGAIELMSLVDRDDVEEKLNQVWLDWYSRRLVRRQPIRG